MKIDITYDLVCPWCYLGLVQLERAITRSAPAGVPATGMPATGMPATLFPFQLTPDLPAGGVDNRDFFERRVGKERAAAMFQLMEEKGREEGIEIDYARVATLPNTYLAHQLVQLANGRGSALRLAIELMAAHFSGARRIGERADLIELAGRHGIGKEEVEAHWRADAAALAMWAAALRASTHAIRGVPHVVVDGVHYPGALPTARWQAILGRSDRIDAIGGA
ncbi:MAG: DsbA family protein [Pseudomonadota bacterium]